MMTLNISEISDASALTLNFSTCFEYWNSLRKAPELPSYKVFALDELPPAILPWSIVTDVMRDPVDYRFRFWGTERAKLIGFEMTGKSLSEIENPDMRSGNWAEYDAICAQKKPLLCDTPIVTATGRQLSMLSIRLPFCDDDGDVTHVFSAVDPTSVTMDHYNHFGTHPRPGV